uniref:Endonuclease V n=2 Tax=unclassified Candidatus Kentrum TaxID=2643149 RepID=A0A451AJ96_9GAMM|nr:MAG: Endonuclease V [Candidatus Kentron sp. LPFa]VFK13273.1 MAG: Endonuclease V [Candidatus Kentron sp. LPFa]VFK24277.1 MAG: Endonuclease V [Candidatus Kentron sp. LPFa]VFK66096.1 MAG: Endonuclease V [Candidatus Kentron sp. UNK]VFK70262.1 MAG: Endonuclease V [Candidatus Kentron sp. UNK]
MGLENWDATPGEAREIQERLRHRVITRDALGAARYVAGIDVGFERNNTITRAAVAVLTFPALELHQQAIARRATSFPYVPGLLSFREAPAVLDALEKLRATPDILLCDGQGIAHPRRLGIASHLGVSTDLPSIGVAKSRLFGVHGPVPEEKGRWTPLLAGQQDNEVIGAVLRTRERVKPLYISIGHRVCLDTAIEYVMACVTRYRLPETTRWAHRLASG